MLSNTKIFKTLEQLLASIHKLNSMLSNVGKNLYGGVLVFTSNEIMKNISLAYIHDEQAKKKDALRLALANIKLLGSTLDSTKPLAQYNKEHFINAMVLIEDAFEQVNKWLNSLSK